MGQLNDTFKKMSFTESKEESPREIFKVNSDNGLVLQDKFIPEELLTEILIHVDHKTLLKCQLVCKRWLLLIQGYVWRKKAERVLHRPLPVDAKAVWSMYYAICSGKFFSKNLIEHKEDFRSRWHVYSEGGDGWELEKTPVGVPSYPEDSVFEKYKFCYVTSYRKCWKGQTIHVKENYPEYLLDNIQPTIKVSEWYCARWDCPSIYMCTIELIKLEDGGVDKYNRKVAKEVLLDSFEFSKTLEGDEQNQWFKFEHEFNNYGKGLSLIRFCHGGQDKSFWAGHYGVKMGGTSITFEIPNKFENSKDKEGNNNIEDDETEEDRSEEDDSNEEDEVHN